MLIAAQRQQILEPEQRDISIPRKILEKMEEKIPEGTGTIDWSKFISNQFMGWWMSLIVTTWNGIDLRDYIVGDGFQTNEDK